MNGRRGVALIMALSVLTALIFLALPFLFSQTASVAGARAAAWDGVARRGQDHATAIAAAASVYATGLHRSPAYWTQLGAAQQQYVQLPAQLDRGVSLPVFADNSWRAVVETSAAWASIHPPLDSTGALHGVVIEDESRRIDPNVLDEHGWAVVLERAGVRDPHTVWWDWDRTLLPAPAGVWKVAGYGRLARALTYARTTQNRRFNRLEDLLAADPNEPVAPAPRTLGCIPFYAMPNYPGRGSSGWPIAEAALESQRNPAESDIAIKTDPLQLGYRVAALTQVELELLRPLLSFLVPGQGRSGLIDLGTVVAASPDPTHWGVTTDELSPGTLKVGLALHNANTWVRSVTGATRGQGNHWVQDDPLAIDAVPALNVNAVPVDSAMTLLFFTGGPAPGWNWTADPVTNPITTIGGLPLLRWLDPRTGNGTSPLFERPPLGLAGFGIVAIEGGATALDPAGQPQAQRRRRMVMQTVPQERPLEAAWTTQGDFEALVRLRHGSWIVAGPLPTNRIKDWGADAVSGSADMAALDMAGWLESAPLCSFGENPLPNLFDWWAPLGLTKAMPWNQVLMSFTTRPSGTTATPSQQPVVFSGLSVAALRPTAGGAPGKLGAQGLTVGSTDTLAWQTGGDTTPLRMKSGPNPNPFRDELDQRHLSLRFSFRSTPVTPVVLLETRAKDVGHDTDAPGSVGFGVPDAVTDDQSVFRVHYDPTVGAEMLVLVIANAALPWTDADRTRFGVLPGWLTGTDDPLGAFYDLQDERCNTVVGGLPLAPAWQAQRVEFRYKVVPALLAPGTWHQLQVYCASDRPGYHGLILDGIVGRDAIDAQQFNQTGDHYTWPSLRLQGAVAGGAVAGSADLSLGSITVRVPPKPDGTAGDVTDVLPIRGVVRIDDEFFSYDSAAGNILTDVRRARRIDTNQGATFVDTNGNGIQDVGELSLGWQAWPLIQDHRDGAIVTPGWSQFQFSSGSWLRGGVSLLAGDPTDITNTGLSHLPPLGAFNTSALPNNLGVPITPATIDIMPIAYAPDIAVSPWAESGVVEFRPVGGATGGRAYFTRAGNTLNLTWSSGTVPDGSTSQAYEAVQISLRVDAAVSTPGDFAPVGALQLLDPLTGRCEWIRYNDTVVAGGSYYFIHTGGGFFRDSLAPMPNPNSDRRGAMRTPWRTVADGPWPAGTLVLPVQTELPTAAVRLEAGDVVTAVPDTLLIAGPPSAPNTPPVQLVVRHAARDGYPTSLVAAGPQWDTINPWFALTHRAPAESVLPNPSDAPHTLLIGRGWGGDDLSSTANNPTRRGQLPRSRLLAVTAGGNDAHLYIASPAPGNTMVGAAVVIDDLCAGSLSGPLDANRSDDAAVTDFGGANSIGAAASDLPVIIATGTATVFSHNAYVYGLAAIDGEVFAYRRIDNSHAELIARALLGSQARSHSVSGTVLVPQGSNPAIRPVVSGLPIVVLPVGPVAELCSPLAANTHAIGLDVVEVPFTNYYKDPVQFANPWQDSNAGDPLRIMRSPFVCVHDPGDGASVELLRVLDRPASNQRITARWLRGLYGTTARAWVTPYTPTAHAAFWADAPPPAGPIAVQGAGELNPIVIGWWPRYAPAMPANPAPEVLRSRSFAWAGFPLRLSGARFDPNIEVLKVINGGVGSVQVADAARCDVHACALAAGDGAAYLFDWDLAYTRGQTLPDAATTTLATLFNWSRFVRREVDGAELKISWQAPAPALAGIFAVAELQGLVPRLGATDAAVGNPPVIDSGVRLRCVAPTRVLAVEDVR